MITALKIHVSGIVQGVGFRPFVYKQAKLNLIVGWVKNSIDGVHIFAQGEEDLIDAFCMSLSNCAPSAAKIEQIEMKEVPLKNYTDFKICLSKENKDNNICKKNTLISPDLATCPDCLKELFDKNNARYRYPFINCTNCGPRFTIIKTLPYDRSNTSMSNFKMCNSCNNEYNNPEDRRFHAQPNSCFKCGPHLIWHANNTKIIADTKDKCEKIFLNCIDMLHNGKIVAIKGLGGFHLACDATNNEAVKKLRRKKLRSNKPFAIMAASIDDAKKICFVNKEEEQILKDPTHPIVLLKKKQKNIIAKNVYMDLPEIGVMLPYTPIQHILMNDFIACGGSYLVMTSANIYNNPIIIDDKVAFNELKDVADAYLGNNRKILSRYDDSVVRVIDAAGTLAVQMIRRARGYCPSPIKIKIDNKNQIFATGAQQKATFAFTRPIDKTKQSKKYNTEVFVGQHIGDIENSNVFESWEKSKNQFLNNFNLKPKLLATDMHPDYLTHKWTLEQNKEHVTVQHHFAHIRSVMYENLLEGPVCGFAFDGTGYGMDKNIWGGECLLCNTKDFERFANFVYVPMPGGVAAIKNPMQMAYGVLWAYDLLDSKAAQNLFKSYNKEFSANMSAIINNEINCPSTSSVGRLFDALSALLGICKNPTYEGEAAIMLEARLWDYLNDNPQSLNNNLCNNYQVNITKNIATKNSTAQDTSVVLMDASNTFSAILKDISNNVEVGKIIKNFHDAIACAILNISQLVNQLYGIKQIVLSGGVFMNRYLIETTIKLLIENGFLVAINKELPPNDGSISLGQIS